MGKILIFLDENIKFSDINKNEYKNIMFSYNISDIKKEDIDSIIYIGSCQKYNNSLENGSIILVNEAFTKENNENKRVLASFSLNYYLNEASNDLNRGISIVNVLSSNDNDRNIQDEMYNKYSCLALDKKAYQVLSLALAFKKKASCLLKVIGKDEILNINDILEVISRSLL